MTADHAACVSTTEFDAWNRALDARVRVWRIQAREIDPKTAGHYERGYRDALLACAYLVECMLPPPAATPDPPP